MKRIISLMVAVMMAAGFMVFQPVYAGNTVQRYVDFRGIQLFTEAYNYFPKAKEGIVYLHSLGGRYSDASFLYDSSNPYMTITMDFINHGNSDDVEKITWDMHIESIKAVIEAYGLNKVTLVGHSFGADTAMMFAKKYHHYVREIILIDGAYFNFIDLARFNFTRDFCEVIEYSPSSGITKEQFSQYFDMAYEDITRTWDINRDVLLIAADPYWAKPDPESGEPSIVEIIAMIKQAPEAFGFTAEEVAKIPDITYEDLDGYCSFLAEKINAFAKVNKKFSVIQTPYSHTMISLDECKEDVREMILDYMKKGPKDKNDKPKDKPGDKPKDKDDKPKDKPGDKPKDKDDKPKGKPGDKPKDKKHPEKHKITDVIPRLRLVD